MGRNPAPGPPLAFMSAMIELRLVPISGPMHGAAR